MSNLKIKHIALIIILLFDIYGIFSGTIDFETEPTIIGITCTVALLVTCIIIFVIAIENWNYSIKTLWNHEKDDY